MKKTTIRLENMQLEATNLQTELTEIEKDIGHVLAKIENCQNRANQICTQARELSGRGEGYYVAERALRLQALLRESEKNLSALPFTAMHRQIERIQDADISKFFGTAIQKSLERRKEVKN